MRFLKLQVFVQGKARGSFVAFAKNASTHRIIAQKSGFQKIRSLPASEG